MKKRKNKAKTVAADVLAATIKKPQIPPHIKLESHEIPFFEAIIESKSYESWTAADLVLTANLARTNAKIERLEQELKKEKDVKKGDRINPKIKIIDNLSRRAIAMSRLLQVHPLATVGQSKDQIKKNQNHRDIREAIDDLDDLIAKPLQ